MDMAVHTISETNPVVRCDRISAPLTRALKCASGVFNGTSNRTQSWIRTKKCYPPKI